MTKEEIRARLDAIREKKNQIASRVDASDDVAEIRAFSQQLDGLNAEYGELETQLYDALEIDAEQARRSASPIGQTQILGTYGLKKTETRKDDKRMYTPDEERRASQAYREAFFKTMTGRATPEERDLVTLSTGSAVIPTHTFDQIIENAQKAQGLISRVRILNIPGKLSIPTSDITTAATWHAEGDPITDSNTPPSSVSLAGFELAKIFSLSASTQAMSIGAFERYLVEELGRAMRDALSDAIINGQGTTEPVGILNGPVWGAGNSVSYASAPTIPNLTTAMKLLASNFRQNAVWSCNSAYFYDVLAGMADANGAPVFSKDWATGAPLSLMGKPVVIDDFAPNDTLLFGDPAYYFVNFSAPIRIERSSEAGFTTGTILYRSLAVVDGRPVAPAFVKIAKA